MKSKRAWTTLSASLAAAVAWGQVAGGDAAACGTWRELEAPADLFHEVVLPREAFAHTLGAAPPGPPAGLRTAPRDDIRVYAVGADGDTTEAPFVWRETAPAAGERRVEPLNAGRLQYGVWRYTFPVDSLATLGALRLVVDRPDFDARVRIEGAQRPDADEWEVIARNARIAALEAPRERLRYTTVSFPPAAYRYYRATVTGIDAPAVVAAAYAELGDGPRIVRYPDAAVDAIGIDRVDETTTVYVSLDAPALVSELEVYASDTLDFARPVRLEALRDTVRRGDATQVIRASRTAAGAISSFAPALIDFTRPAVARHLRLTIDDGDDRPLEIDSVAVRGPESALVARFAAVPGARYFLAYGCEALAAPRYDLDRYRERLPDTVTRLAVGEVVARAAPEVDDGDAAGFALGRWWIYVALAGVAALLGWAALRLFRSA